jgi:hypothetical protein
VNWIDITSGLAAADAYVQAPSLDAFIGFIRNHYPEQYASEGTIRTFIDQWAVAHGSPGFVEQSINFTGLLLKMQMDVPTIGASGAVYGILLAFGMIFPNMLFFLILIPIPVKAKWIVIAYGVIELVSGLSNNPNDNVAHFAHLGGMIFGFFLILYWKKKTGGYSI